MLQKETDNFILQAIFFVLLHELQAHGLRSTDDSSRLDTALVCGFESFVRIIVSQTVTPARLWEHGKRKRTALRELSSSGGLDPGYEKRNHTRTKLLFNSCEAQRTGD